MSLAGKIAVVTGASRGIGKGIALQLGEAGAKVFVTGRPRDLVPNSEYIELPTLEKTAQEISERGGTGVAKYVDHSDMKQVEKFFKEIKNETDGVVDILVNNAFSAVESICNSTEKKFWELEPSVWDDINNVGLRNHYYCSVYAARMMVPRRSGLIVNISSYGAIKYFFNVAYGVGKCATDRMSVDMAHELKDTGVTVVSLWPGIVRTELFSEVVNRGVFDESESKLRTMLSEGESPEFSGKAVVSLASDKNVMQKTGRSLIAADLGMEYKFRDIDGRQPPSFRSVKALVDLGGYKSVAKLIPGFVRVPGWLMSASGNKV